MSIPAAFAVPDRLAARAADQFWVVTMAQCLRVGLTVGRSNGGCAAEGGNAFTEASSWCIQVLRR